MKTKKSGLKRLVTLVAAICMMVAMMLMLLVEAKAATDVVGSGQMGDNVYWTLAADGVLTVSGTGATWDYEDPWNGAGKEWQNVHGPDGRWVSVKSVKINEGVTVVGKLALAAGYYRSVEIPVSVVSIGDMAFLYCKDLADIYYAGSEVQWKRVKIDNRDDGNEALFNATVHYGVTEQKEEPSTWAAAEVNSAIAAGLVPEDLQKNYQGSVSRGDVAQMFINLIEKSSGKDIGTFMAEKGVSTSGDAFVDTSDEAVLAANALGIINGVGNNKFNPDGTLTRAQIAAIINRVAKTLGVDTDGCTHNFVDVFGHWVDAELGWPTSVGIINGVGNNKFNPDAELTTEQTIAITYRAFKVLAK